MGVDTGKGIGKDRSTIQVLKIADKFDIKQVAVYKNDKIGTYDFAEVCISVSKFLFIQLFKISAYLIAV